MFSRINAYRFVTVLLAALLTITGLQTSATAATSRTLTLSASPAASTVGSAVTFSGKISRSPKGTVVVIERKSGSKWVRATSTRTVNAAGNFAVKIARPKTVANYYFRATSAKKGSLKAAVSKTIAVAALRKTLASLSTSTSSTTAGTKVSLSGTVLPSVTNTVVTAQRKVGSAWSNVATTKVLSNGTFKVDVTPTTTTTYRAVVSRTTLNASATTNERTVSAKPRIDTTSLPTGKRLTPYPSTKLVTYGNQVGTWSASPLPAGLTLNASTGIISGTPTAVETKQVVIGFTQLSTGLAAATRTIQLTVNQADKPVISTTTLPNGQKLASYSATLTAAGNPAGTWTAAPLPNGLTLNPTTGAITGTVANDALTTDVVVGFTETSTGLAANSRTITLTIGAAAAPVISTTSLPPGSKGDAYTATLTATGNPAGTWTASPLPDGLTLNPSTGVISGTPSLDAVSTNVVIGFTQTSTGVAATPKTLTLQIDAGNAPVINTASLPNGTRLAVYSTQLAAAGNPAGTWTASPLPNGLTLNPNTGVISGTPTAVGTTNVVIGFTQTNNGLSATPKTLALVINEAAAPIITTSSLPDGTRFASYSTTLTAQGNPQGTWTASPLPNGLSLNTDTGVISGNPSTPGDTEVVIGFTQTSTGVAATPKTLTLHVNQAPAPVISTSALPDATRLSPYTFTLTATGNPPGTWSASPLPAGLSLNTSTGVISGTPTTVETKQVLIEFTQTSTGLAAEPKTLSLVVNQAAPPVIATAALTSGNRQTPYTFTLTATGNPAGTWSASPLPAGLSLNTSTGVISGTPTAVETKAVVIGFTQTSTGVAAVPKTLNLVINEAAPPVISSPATLPQTSPLAPYSYQLQASGAVGTWKLLSGAPITGITLKSDGRVSGAAPLPGNSSFTVEFTQTNTGLKATKTFTLKCA